MENKQKQIEEMAKDILKQAKKCDFVLCKECNYYNGGKITETSCQTIMISEELYNAGYRKIPENAVVLTEKEFSKLKTLETLQKVRDDMGLDYSHGREEGYAKARKETAREILQKVKSYTLDKEVGMKYLIKRLGEEYSVEV